jgi:hypothetical protein
VEICYESATNKFSRSFVELIGINPSDVVGLEDFWRDTHGINPQCSMGWGIGFE